MLSEVLEILTVAHFGPEQWPPLNGERYYLTFKYVELAPSSHFCVLYPWVLDNLYSLHPAMVKEGPTNIFSSCTSVSLAKLYLQMEWSSLVGTKGSVQSTEHGAGNIWILRQHVWNIKVSVVTQVLWIVHVYFSGPGVDLWQAMTLLSGWWCCLSYLGHWTLALPPGAMWKQY